MDELVYVCYLKILKIFINIEFDQYNSVREYFFCFIFPIQLIMVDGFSLFKYLIYLFTFDLLNFLSKVFIKNFSFKISQNLTT